MGAGRGARAFERHVPLVVEVDFEDAGVGLGGAHSDGADRGAGDAEAGVVGVGGFGVGGAVGGGGVEAILAVEQAERAGDAGVRADDAGDAERHGADEALVVAGEVHVEEQFGDDELTRRVFAQIEQAERVELAQRDVAGDFEIVTSCFVVGGFQLLQPQRLSPASRPLRAAFQ